MESKSVLWAETQGCSFHWELDNSLMLFVSCSRPVECSSQARQLNKEGEITRGNSAPIQVIGVWVLWGWTTPIKVIL